MLKVQDITKSFTAETKVLDGVNFTVEKGEIIYLLGGNGSGKSTLLKILAGFYKPDKGIFTLQDKNLARLPPHKISKFIHYLHQSKEDNIAPSLTLLEALFIAISNNSSNFSWFQTNYYKKSAEEILEPIELNLKNKINQQLKSFSGGESQVIVFLLTLELIKNSNSSNNILLFDEFTSQLDFKLSAQIIKFAIALINKSNLTAIIVTHNIQEALDHADRILILKNGTITKALTRDKQLFNSKEEIESLIF